MTKIELMFIKDKTLSDLMLTGYAMFLNDEGLTKEAQEFVSGFIHALTDTEVKALALRNKELIESRLNNENQN